MSQKSSPANLEIPKTQKTEKKRRTKEQISHEYICGDINCKKKYGTSAALYTHIKNKHSGQQPLGTKRQIENLIQNKKKKKKKLGRPSQFGILDLKLKAQKFNFQEFFYSLCEKFSQIKQEIEQKQKIDSIKTEIEQLKYEIQELGQE